MASQTLRPDQGFSKLQPWWRLHEGFGLFFIFSDDQAGLHWLENRTAEEIQHREAVRNKSINPIAQVHALMSVHEPNPAALFTLLSGVKVRQLFWIHPPARCIATWLTRLNEQRQTLIGSGALFVFCLPAQGQLHASSIAPDLWSVRSMAYVVQSRSSNAHLVAERHAAHPAYVSTHEKPHLTQTDLTPNIAAWHRLFAKWSNDANSQNRSILSISLGLQAHQDAIKLHQFENSKIIALQAEQVSAAQQDDLGRANTLQALGDLDHRLGQVDSARGLYTQAIALYEKEQDAVGLAYTWAELARLSTPWDDAMAKKSIAYAAQSASPLVVNDIAALFKTPTSRT